MEAGLVQIVERRLLSRRPCDVLAEVVTEDGGDDGGEGGGEESQCKMRAVLAKTRCAQGES